MKGVSWPPMDLRMMFANVSDLEKRPELYNVAGMIAILERQADECEQWLKFFRVALRAVADKHGVPRKGKA